MINTLWCILLMRKFEINFLYVACNQGIYWNLEKNSENFQIFLQIFLFKISSKIREFFEAIKDRNSIRLLFSITGVTKPVGRFTTINILIASMNYYYNQLYCLLLLSWFFKTKTREIYLYMRLYMNIRGCLLNEDWYYQEKMIKEIFLKKKTLEFKFKNKIPKIFISTDKIQ